MRILIGLLIPSLLFGQQARTMTRSTTGFGDSSLVVTSDTLTSKTTFVTKAVSLAQIRKSLSKFAFDSLVSSGPARIASAVTIGSTVFLPNLTPLEGNGHNLIFASGPNTIVGDGVGDVVFNNIISVSPAGAVSGITTLATSDVATSTKSGGGASSGFYVNATAPSFGWRASGGGADSKVWDITSDATTQQFRVINDAASSSLTWLTATRTGIASVAVAFNGAVSGITTLASDGAYLSSGADTLKTKVFARALSAEGSTKSTLCIDPVTFEILTNAAATCTVSSARYKTNIKDLTDEEASNIVFNLRPKSYNEIASGRPGINVIAEQADSVDYRLAARMRDGRIQSVNEEMIVASLLKVVQNQQARFDRMCKAGIKEAC